MMAWFTDAYLHHSSSIYWILAVSAIETPANSSESSVKSINMKLVIFLDIMIKHIGSGFTER